VKSLVPISFRGGRARIAGRKDTHRNSGPFRQREFDATDMDHADEPRYLAGGGSAAAFPAILADQPQLGQVSARGRLTGQTLAFQCPRSPEVYGMCAELPL
jgi:hypothetical protein